VKISITALGYNGQPDGDPRMSIGELMTIIRDNQGK
jgi:hypothetical protein